MEKFKTYDANVARLELAHPVLFEGRMPTGWSNLPAGWYDLVDRLCSDIEQELGPYLARRVTIRQIKEKFGTLPFYTGLDGSGDTHIASVSERACRSS